jgi:hypothetical protein
MCCSEEVNAAFRINYKKGITSMTKEKAELTARLSEDELDILERRLDIAIARLLSGDSFRVRGLEKGINRITKVPGQGELEMVAQEVMKTARVGVRIAPLVESRPLVPLFEAAKIDLPPEVKVDHEQMKYDFYCVESTFSILLSRDQFPLSAELDITLTDDAHNTARSTRPLRLFPGRKDIRFFTADLEGGVGIDASMNISTPEVGLQLPTFAQVSTKMAMDARLKANFVVGPLTFPFRRAAIEVIGESDQRIFWRYNLQSELKGANVFKSVLILKVPQEVQSAQMETTLSVIPCTHRWLVFRNMLPKLSDTRSLIVELTSS